MPKILIHWGPIVESKILEEVAALVLMVGPPHVMRVKVQQGVISVDHGEVSQGEVAILVIVDSVHQIFA